MLGFPMYGKESTDSETEHEWVTLDDVTRLKEKLDVPGKWSNNFRIVESPYMIEQFRFPRSKKRRIRAKWTQRSENWRPRRDAVFIEDTIYIHPNAPGVDELIALCNKVLGFPRDLLGEVEKVSTATEVRHATTR